MSKAQALLIGVNQVDPAAYGGKWDGKLRFCESDTQVIAEIASKSGIETAFLHTRDATIANVKKAISAAADTLVSGDLFLLFYSGHGGSIKDRSGDEWADKRDETWCLYDGDLLDDELFELWPRFAKGVRIVMMSDSCHSGSMTRGGKKMAVKAIPKRVVDGLVRKDPKRYTKIRQALQKDPGDIEADVLLISGCKSFQRSYESRPEKQGQFTAYVRKVWDGGNFSGNYEEFHEALEQAMPKNQTPHLDLSLMKNNQFSSVDRAFAI